MGVVDCAHTFSDSYFSLKKGSVGLTSLPLVELSPIKLTDIIQKLTLIDVA